jgi:beta-1,4-mannosyl-glycoprotein beta-1,4-N-acetylglucosaminyltransferase
MASRALLPLTIDEEQGRYHDLNSKSAGIFTRSYRRIRRRPKSFLFIFVLALLVLFNGTAMGTFRRDFVYLIRPIWDHPEKSFNVIPHYPPPITGKRDWCKLHGWTPRPMAAERPMIVDAVPISTELDMLEIRMREYAPFVKIFVIVESPMTFSGRPKPLFFAQQRDRFDKIAEDGGAKIVYAAVEGMKPNLPVGSFENEIKQRITISNLLNSLKERGEIPEGSLVIQSDIDEIISRQTLDLLTSCSDYPDQLHLNVKNYRYSFNFPLLDTGYWRPRVVTVNADEEIPYHHGRGSDWLLDGAGWHCSFCFPTLDDMRAKMQGYAHNDRVRDKSIMNEDILRGRVCRGEDPFGMYPVSYIYARWIIT